MSTAAAPAKTAPRHEVWARVDPYLIGVTMLALLLRVYPPGLFEVIWDEVNVLFWSMQIAENGNFILTSNNWFSGPWVAEWNPIHKHSPLVNYITAIPYWFLDDPRAVRFFVGLLGALSVLVVYLTVSRYAGKTAAVFAGLLMAVSVPAIEWVRFISNPNVAPLFIAGWAFTGLLGYYEGRKWPKVWHWTLLVLAIQAHPANALLGVPSLFLLVAGWFGESRGALVRWTLLGWFVAALTLVPWVAGSIYEEQLQSSLMQPGFQVIPEVEPSTSETLDLTLNPRTIFDRFSRLFSTTTYRFTERGYPVETWWPPQWTDNLLRLHTVFVLVGSIYLLVDGVRQRREGIPQVFFVLVALFPVLFGVVFANDSVQDFYLLGVLVGGFALQGVLLARMLRAGRLWRGLAVTLAGIYVVLNIWLFAGTVHWLQTAGWTQSLRAPLNTFRGWAAEWTAETGDAVVVIDSSDFENKFTRPDSQRYLWTVAANGYPLRPVMRFNGQGVPVAPSGTVIVELSNGGTITRLPGDVETFGATVLDPETPVFQRTLLTPNDLPAFDLRAWDVSRFENGARVLGLTFDDDLTPGVTVPMTLFWQVERDQPGTEYQFSVRLIDEAGQGYGQQDFRSLDAALWRTGDTVFHPFEMPLNENDSNGANLRAQILMYTHVGVVNIPAVNADGSSAGDWLYLAP